MASSFSFVPRKVAKPNKPASQDSSNKHTRIPPIQSTVSRPEQNSVDIKGKGKANDKAEDEDYAILISLALSNHAIWSDPDLRRVLEWSSDSFVPLSYLLRHSAVISRSGKHLELEPEAVIVKALRRHASDMVEVRVLVSQPSRSDWLPKDRSSQKEDVGGYEIRRKDWGGDARPERDYTKSDWDERTLYMENIPPQHRSIPGIVRFTRALMPKAMSIEAVTLPPHHQDQPGDPPKCKGFALVTLSNTLDIDYFFNEWPWEQDYGDGKALDGEITDIRVDARKYGFRLLLKSRWESLQAEYLAYRRTLLDEIAAFEDNLAHQSQAETHSAQQYRYERPQAQPTRPEGPQESADPSVLDPSSPYPPNCLIFVRNIHPETNKTTLRSLFSAAFKDTDLGDGLDYVDFNKGMDSCHLRLATPSHTSVICAYFSSHPKTQSSGLDDKGIPDTTNVITTEIVMGKKEELYWEKVPEKVRKLAVQKQVTVNSVETDHVGVQEEGVEGARKRKRRKKAI